MDGNHFAGVILAGGAASRLAGADKPMLDVGGTPLLRRSVDALGGAECVLVGTPRSGFEEFRWTVEDPPGSGPAAALAAGLSLLPARADPVAVLAGDLLGVTGTTVSRLHAALGSADGAVLVDAAGHRQWLLGVWRASPLRSAVGEHPVNRSLRGTLGKLRIAEVPASGTESRDVDTPEDLARARRAPGSPQSSGTDA